MDLETKAWGTLTIIGLWSLIGLGWLPGLALFVIGGLGLVVHDSYSDSSL